MQQVLRQSVGGRRDRLAAALAAAAGLAGWQALDRGDIQRAWDLHDVARTAARESGSKVLLAHVTAQSTCVLLDAQQERAARDLIESVQSDFSRSTPRLLTTWLAATQAEVLAANGQAHAAHLQLDRADALLGAGNADESLPYLMLNESHLARWRGHCLARLGEREAIDYLTTALAGAGDSVRAATGLHVDLALAYSRAGLRAEAQTQVAVASDLASHYGSRRQQLRLRPLLPPAERQVVQ
jgi:hypothetical protein